jgi:LytS/YehU family sensor histidine kinase
LFEYEHLKTQVNPHFLFNSLNTLTGLIEQDPESAITYTEQLSDLYRNLLAYKGNDWVTLEEEWSFLANYLYIQESRFGSALQVVKNIPEALMKSKKIVPLSLQLLVENAIKHNVVSMASPLVVKFEIQEDVLVVSNTIQPKLSKEKESGLGLANIQKRYALLSDKPISFGKKDGVWEVRLPLL